MIFLATDAQMFFIHLIFLYFWVMGRLKIYNTDIPRESILAEREALYLSKSAEQKIYALLQLNHVAVQLNGGKPLKQPQGKGLLIRKVSHI
ncbi:MAG: hypothetical protein REI64_01725 [Pedobacter sp.]|nr:hypothetical protein [Pedobacter sp.]